MGQAKARIKHKYFHLDSAKISRAQKILHANTETETIERALDLVLSDHMQKQLASDAEAASITTAKASRFIAASAHKYLHVSEK